MFAELYVVNNGAEYENYRNVHINFFHKLEWVDRGAFQAAWHIYHMTNSPQIQENSQTASFCAVYCYSSNW